MHRRLGSIKSGSIVNPYHVSHLEFKEQDTSETTNGIQTELYSSFMPSH